MKARIEPVNVPGRFPMPANFKNAPFLKFLCQEFPQIYLLFSPRISEFPLLLLPWNFSSFFVHVCLKFLCFFAQISEFSVPFLEKFSRPCQCLKFSIVSKVKKNQFPNTSPQISAKLILMGNLLQTTLQSAPFSILKFTLEKFSTRHTWKILIIEQYTKTHKTT